MNSAVAVELLSDLLSFIPQWLRGQRVAAANEYLVEEIAVRMLRLWKYNDVPEPQLGSLRTWLRSELFDPNGRPKNVLDVVTGQSVSFFDLQSTTWTYAEETNPVPVRRKLPVRLLLAIATANWRSSIAEEDCFDCQVSNESDFNATIRSGLADGHVHIGAAVPFLGLLFSAVDAIQAIEPEEKRIVWYTTDTGTYRLDVLLMAAKIMLHTLWQFVSLSSPDTSSDLGHFIGSCEPLSHDVREALTSSDFWSQVGQATQKEPSQAMEGRSQIPAWLTEAVLAFPSYSSAPTLSFEAIVRSTFPNIVDLDDVAFQVAFRLFRYSIEHPDDTTYNLHLTQLVRCICILYRAITPAMEGGLEVFVRAFDNHKALRRTGSLQSRREDLVTHGLRYLNRNDNLKKLELRTSLDFRRGERPSSTQVTGDLVKYLHKYKEHLELEPEGQVRVVFPITFVRRPESEAPPLLHSDRVACVWQFGELYNSIVALAEFFRAHPVATQFFGVIDVAGDENQLSNWLLFHLLAELDTRLRPSETRAFLPYPLQYTYHAGEYFSTPLNGLRRIGEVVDYMPQVKRIGHGLALGCSEWFGDDFARWPVEQISHELLDDLTWARQRLTGPLRQDIETHISALAEELYGGWAAGDANLLVNAYKLRFRSGILNTLGVLAANSQLSTEIPSSYYGSIFQEHLSPASGSSAMRLLAQYITNQNNNHDLQTHPTSLANVRTLLKSVYEELLPQILDKFRERGIMIECCPTSNLIIAKIPSYSKHPIFRFVEEGLEVTINTDDPGIFHVTIDDEYASIWQGTTQLARSMKERKSWLSNVKDTGMEAFATAVGQLTIPQLKAALEGCIQDLDSGTRGVDNSWESLS